VAVDCDAVCELDALEALVEELILVCFVKCPRKDAKC
jgi:hypothetical protein